MLDQLTFKDRLKDIVSGLAKNQPKVMDQIKEHRQFVFDTNLTRAEYTDFLVSLDKQELVDFIVSVSLDR